MTAIVNFDEYFNPLYGSYMLIPQNAVFFRGYDKRYPVVSDWPSHFSTEHVASSYASGPDKALGAFTNPNRPLRVVDYRYLKVLLVDLFQNRPDNEVATIDPIARTSVGYGMCDIADQIKLGTNMFGNSAGMVALKKYYDTHIKNKNYVEKPLDVNPIQTTGCRIAETHNDTYILQFIKDCMGHIFDGFVAPRENSPYHVEKNGMMSPELILFSPETAGIVLMPSIPQTLPTITMNDILKYQATAIHIAYKQLRASHYKMVKVESRAHTGGSGESISASDEIFLDAYVNKNKDALKLLKSATTAAKKWKKQFTFHDQNARHPQSVVSDWFTGSGV